LACSRSGDYYYKETGIGVGIIAAIVIGVVVLVALAIAFPVAFCCCGVALCGCTRQRPGSVVGLQSSAQAHPSKQQACAPAGQTHPPADLRAVPASDGQAAIQYTDNRMARTGT
jgi:hypothetical protein